MRNFWRPALVAAMLCAGSGGTAAEDAQQPFDRAVDALGDLAPSENQVSPTPPDDLVTPPPLPMPRPDDRAIAPDVSEVPVPLPEARPGAADDAADSDIAPASADRVYQAACPAVMNGLVEAEMMPPIAEAQCGLQSPLGVTAVMIAGRRVPLSQPATLNCAMAGELAHWAGRVDAYSQAMHNSGLAEISSGTSYYCRGRNNVDGADISEHGFGNAIDVTGFTLEDGTRISLPDDWGDKGDGPTMELAHDTACGFFTTVLGPDANTLHADHLHLDLGCHGQTCTARLCE